LDQTFFDVKTLLLRATLKDADRTASTARLSPSLFMWHCMIVHSEKAESMRPGPATAKTFSCLFAAYRRETPISSCPYKKQLDPFSQKMNIFKKKGKFNFK
jgi:hypothetical protein